MRIINAGKIKKVVKLEKIYYEEESRYVSKIIN